MLVSGALSAASFTLVLEKLVNEISKWNLEGESDEGTIKNIINIGTNQIKNESVGTRILLSALPFLLFSLGYAIVYLNDKYTPKII